MENQNVQESNIFDHLIALLEGQDESLLRAALIDLHPADIAEAVSRLDEENQIRIFSLLEDEAAAEVLVDLDGATQRDVLQLLSEPRLVGIIETLDSDDATDIVGALDKEVAERILAAMPWKEFREVETLLRHEEDTAGGIMALEVVAVNERVTAKGALKALREKSEEVDDVYNIYVVDSKGILKGIVALKDLVLANPRRTMRKLMETDPIAVQTEMDQEEVANLFRKYDLVVAPVVDIKGRLVGRITVDDVIDVMEEEASEDFSRFAGITDEELGARSIWHASYVRLPWLLVAFVGELFSAMVLNYFMPSHNELLFATIFIPLIIAMAGNIGIQSSTVIIRGLATGDIHLRDTGRRLFREISVAFTNGIIISLLLLGVVTFWFHNPKFGSVLSVALLSVLFVAAFAGTLIPLYLKRLKIDPAIATGPFITTSNDVVGLIIYFSIIKAVGF